MGLAPGPEVRGSFGHWRLLRFRNFAKAFDGCSKVLRGGSQSSRSYGVRERCSTEPLPACSPTRAGEDSGPEGGVLSEIRCSGIARRRHGAVPSFERRVQQRPKRPRTARRTGRNSPNRVARWGGMDAQGIGGAGGILAKKEACVLRSGKPALQPMGAAGRVALRRGLIRGPSSARPEQLGAGGRPRKRA